MICASGIVAISLIFVSNSFCMEKIAKSPEQELVDAVIANDLPTVTQLLGQGVSANARGGDTYDNFAIFYATWDRIDPEIVKQLLIHGANPNTISPGTGGDTALHCAVKNYNGRDKDKKIKYLLDHGADLELKEECFAQTPLLYAARYNSSDIFPLLLQRGANLNAKDTSEYTALAYGVDRSHRNVILAILSNKFCHPNTYFLKDDGKSLFRHAQERYSRKVHDYEDVEKERKQTLQKIGKALMIFEGFYTGRSRIARQGLAQVFPIDLAKYMARCFDYKSILFNSAPIKT